MELLGFQCHILQYIILYLQATTIVVSHVRIEKRAIYAARGLAISVPCNSTAVKPALIAIKQMNERKQKEKQKPS